MQVHSPFLIRCLLMTLVFWQLGYETAIVVFDSPIFFKTKIYDVIKKYGYRVSKKKVKSYSKLCPKLVTGVIIDSAGQLTLRNSLRKKIIDEFVHLKNHPDDVISRKRLKGLITAARQIDRTAYPNIYKFVFQKHAK